MGGNQRYATRGQRARYDNESYQDDEEDEEEAHAYRYHPAARTGDCSRESLGLVAQTVSHPEAVPSRSLEVNEHGKNGLQQSNFPINKN